MWLLQYCMLVLLALGSCFPALNASTCEEKETSRLKLDLVKQSISDAKSLYPKCTDEMNDSNCTAKDKSLAHLNVALELLSVTNATCNKTCPEPEVIVLEDKPMDCSDIQAQGFNKNGIYKVWPRRRNNTSNQSIDVWCDMEMDGGGWTLIQRRGRYRNMTDFYQDWEAYKNGFGDLNGEFWLGNENIFALSNQGVYSARFDLVDNGPSYKYAVYSSFSIGDENSQYVLQIQNHTGTLTDDMIGHNMNVFSTKDRLNNNKGNSNCAIAQSAGFWFASGSDFGFGCGRVNLNGLYRPGNVDRKNMFWYQWKSSAEGLASSKIKLRRTYL